MALVALFWCTIYPSLPLKPPCFHCNCMQKDHNIWISMEPIWHVRKHPACPSSLGYKITVVNCYGIEFKGCNESIRMRKHEQNSPFYFPTSAIISLFITSLMLDIARLYILIFLLTLILMSVFPHPMVKLWIELFIILLAPYSTCIRWSQHNRLEHTFISWPQL